jgi:hypothetical protein
MSSGLILIIAMSTAVGVIVLALLVSNLVRTLGNSAADLVPDFSRVPGLFSRRLTAARQTVRSVGKGRGRSTGLEQARTAGHEHARSADKKPAPPGKELLAPADSKRAVPAKPVAPHVAPGRSIDVKFRQSKAERSEPSGGERAERGPGLEGSAEGGSAAYRHVGDEVAAVLTAAEQAAAQIRETALREAEQTRLDAEEKVAASLADVQARRAEVDNYSEETRDAADAYAEETHRSANEKAARRVSQAEEQARRIQAEAKEKARELEAEAGRRRDELTKSAEALEVRIESMLAAFRGVITEFDELLPTERRSTADVPKPPVAERLDEALKPASWHG